jgi:hypothetical protein
MWKDSAKLSWNSLNKNLQSSNLADSSVSLSSSEESIVLPCSYFSISSFILNLCYLARVNLYTANESSLSTSHLRKLLMPVSNSPTVNLPSPRFLESPEKNSTKLSKFYNLRPSAISSIVVW